MTQKKFVFILQNETNDIVKIKLIIPSIDEIVFEIYRNGSHLWRVSCLGFRLHFALALLVVSVFGASFLHPQY